MKYLKLNAHENLPITKNIAYIYNYIIIDILENEKWNFSVLIPQIVYLCTDLTLTSNNQTNSLDLSP